MVVRLEVLKSSLDVGHAALSTHLLGGEVGVHAGTVPGTLHGLGVDGDLDTKVLSNTGKEEASHPKLVTHLNAVTGTNLVLPLGGHDFGVGARDLDASEEAGLVVSLDDVTHDNLASTDTAVVRTLGSGETTGGPAKRSVIEIKEGVLLLETEPGLVVSVGLHNLGTFVAEVELVGGSIGVPALSKDDDVGGTAEGIGVDGARAKVDIRVVAGGLLGRGTIEVPDGEVFSLVVGFLQGLVRKPVSCFVLSEYSAKLRKSYSRLGASLAVGVNPDVLSHNHTLLIKLEVLVELLKVVSESAREIIKHWVSVPSPFWR